MLPTCSVPTEDHEESRALRFSGLIAPSIFKTQHLAVVGCGAIGRSIALLLSQLPIGSLTLIDFDRVSAENLGPQGYSPLDIGTKKVDALRSECHHRQPSLPIFTLDQKLDTLSPLTPSPTFIFLCVDSMASRKSLSESTPCPLIDCRMGLQIAHLYYRPLHSPSYHNSSLHPDSESIQEPCTLRSSPWCATAAASLALSIFALHLRRLPIPAHLSLNLFILSLVSPISAFDNSGPPPLLEP